MRSPDHDSRTAYFEDWSADSEPRPGWRQDGWGFVRREPVWTRVRQAYRAQQRSNVERWHRLRQAWPTPERERADGE